MTAYERIQPEHFTEGQLSGPEGRAEVMARLCRVLYILHGKRVGFQNGPCDCICPDRTRDEKNFRSDGEALRWLEKLVDGLPEGKARIRVEEAWTTNDYGCVTWEPPTITSLGHESRSSCNDGGKQQ